MLPQLVLRTKKRRQAADKDAIALAAKNTRRINSAAKKRKRETLAEALLG